MALKYQGKIYITYRSFFFKTICLLLIYVLHICKELVADLQAFLQGLVNSFYAVLHGVLGEDDVLVTVEAAVTHAIRRLHDVRDILDEVLLERVLAVVIGYDL